MATRIRFFLFALAVTAPVSLALRAADPIPPRTTGRVLVLANERTLEGDIQRQGERYIIRRSVGETSVPAHDVLYLCADYPEAYASLRSRANLDDPDERLRLAVWCQLNGLRDQALTEVTAALAIRPGHAASRRLQQSLQRSSASTCPAPAAPAKEEAEGPTTSTSVELTAESLGMYVTKVQPILMNTCASCHASGRGGVFKLLRSYDGGTANRKTTQQNLTAVLAQVNLERPQTSSLLTKAVSVHADMTQAPLKGRDTPAYRTLEEWVQLTLRHNPQLREQAGLTRTAIPPIEPKPPAEFAASRGAAPPTDAIPARPVTANKSSAPPLPLPENKGATGPSPSSSGPVDPFDPVIFNQQLHPDKKAGLRQ